MNTLTPLADLDIEQTASSAEIQAAAHLLSRYGQSAPVKIRGRKVLTASGKTTVAAAAHLGWFFLETTR